MVRVTHMTGCLPYTDGRSAETQGGVHRTHSRVGAERPYPGVPRTAQLDGRRDAPAGRTCLDEVGDVDVETSCGPRGRRGGGEGRLCQARFPATLRRPSADTICSAFARIENHYFVNDVRVDLLGRACRKMMAVIGIHEGRTAA